MAQALVNIRMDEEVSVDPFYSQENMTRLKESVAQMAHLRRGVEALDAGKGVEHEIIEADE